MEYHVWRVEHELELSRTKGGEIQGLPQNFGGDPSPGFRPIAEKTRLQQQNATAVVPAVPASSVAHVAGKMSARTFPCRGVMQVMRLLLVCLSRFTDFSQGDILGL